MPTLTGPKQPRSVFLPPRKAVLAAETDVLVVGGGPAGLGAALGAADAGARVVLAERYGFLGGNATAALVMPLMSYHTQAGRPEPSASRRPFPRDHGPGEPVIAGALEKLVSRLSGAKGALSPSAETGYTVPFDPEALKTAALGLLDEAGVELLLHSLASDVLTDRGGFAALDGASLGRVKGVVFETKSGPIVVRADVVVDCTGDGDIAAAAGVPYEIGRESDGLVQPMTLMFRLGSFDQESFGDFVEARRDQWRGVHGLWDLVREAAESGELELQREDLLFFAGMHPGEVVMNSTRVAAVSGVDVFDLTRAEVAARRQMVQIVSFLKRRVPGFERSYLMQSGSEIGVRETRRIEGEYRLCAGDVMAARKFDDAIARCPYPIDIHDPMGTGTRLDRLPEGESYDIPLRCLLPLRAEGLLVAGRCISGSHEAHSSFRVMPASMATGQAAGVCAALAGREGSLPRQVAALSVQAELLRQGASLGEAVQVAAAETASRVA